MDGGLGSGAGEDLGGRDAIWTMDEPRGTALCFAKLVTRV